MRGGSDCGGDADEGGATFRHRVNCGTRGGVLRVPGCGCNAEDCRLGQWWQGGGHQAIVRGTPAVEGGDAASHSGAGGRRQEGESDRGILRCGRRRRRSPTASGPTPRLVPGRRWPRLLEIDLCVQGRSQDLMIGWAKMLSGKFEFFSSNFSLFSLWWCTCILLYSELAFQSA
jgi:hypothetical protein